jgi:hypothetical protein
MRLAGSIAWPLKPGRQMERTELQTFADGRPRRYYAERIARAFPPEEDKRDTPPSASDGGTSSLELGLHGAGVTVEAVMADIRTGRLWHNNMVRLVGHWIARGWSDEEILTAAGNLTLAGYTVDQTRQEVSTMISGGREKWSVPNPARQIETSVAADIDLFDWTADRYTGEPEPIQWLCAGTIPLGEPGLIAAMGGLGKSYLALDLALSIAAGVAGFEQPKAMLGGRIAVEGTAVMLAAEDGLKAIHRRLYSIDPDYRRLRHPRRLIVVPMPNAGGPRPLIASDGKNLTKAAFFESLSRQLAGIDDLRLIVIDPLQAFVLADVNADPAAAQFMWSAFAELCASTGATLLVTHHMRKDGGFRIRSADEARESVRGTTALIDGGRFAYALWKVDEAEGEEICRRLGLEPAPGSVARGAVIKANDEADFSEHTYIRQETGLLVQCESEPETVDRDDARLSKTKAHEILEEIQRRFDDGNPFSHAPNSGARYVVPFFTRQHGMRRDAARNLLADWINNGVVTVDLSNRKTKLMGLRVAKWV